jgi:hypothetical protein
VSSGNPSQELTKICRSEARKLTSNPVIPPTCSFLSSPQLQATTNLLSISSDLHFWTLNEKQDHMTKLWRVDKNVLELSYLYICWNDAGIALYY